MTGRGLVVGIAIAWAGVAHAVQGTATLQGTEVLRVQRCGRAKEAVTVDVVVAGSGVWQAATADGPFAGAWVTADAKGRKVVLDLDDASEAAFLALQASTAGVLCGSTVTIDAATPGPFLLRLNPKRTKAKLLLKYAATGSTAAGAGAARYKLAARGAWADGPYLDCAGLFACLGDCFDDPCFQGCFGNTTPAGLADYQALSDCVLAICLPDDFACQEAAVAGPCAPQAAACS